LIERFAGVQANQLVTVREGSGISKSALPAKNDASKPGEQKIRK
jgi:hypothetical protein